MDPPRHTKLRKLVSAAFTRGRVRRIRVSIQANARPYVEELRDAGSGADSSTSCAKELPISSAVGNGRDPESSAAHGPRQRRLVRGPTGLPRGSTTMRCCSRTRYKCIRWPAPLAAERRATAGDD